MADFPGSITSFTPQVNTGSPVIDEYSLDAADVNDAYDEIEAIETELGINPAGSEADVADRLTEIELGRLPIGAIIMWGGTYASIPSGFSICNGSGGTPNLQDRFICATSGSENPGTTGGTHALTLVTANLPSHNHTGGSNSTGGHFHTTDSQGIHNHAIKKDTTFATGVSRAGPRQGASSEWSGGDPVMSSGNHSHTTSSASNHSHVITVGFTGSGTAFNNRPLYYELCFIQRTS